MPTDKAYTKPVKSVQHSSILLLRAFRLSKLLAVENDAFQSNESAKHSSDDDAVNCNVALFGENTRSLTTYGGNLTDSTNNSHKHSLDAGLGASKEVNGSPDEDVENVIKSLAELLKQDNSTDSMKSILSKVVDTIMLVEESAAARELVLGRLKAHKQKLVDDLAASQATKDLLRFTMMPDLEYGEIYDELLECARLLSLKAETDIWTSPDISLEYHMKLLLEQVLNDVNADLSVTNNTTSTCQGPPLEPDEVHAATALPDSMYLKSGRMFMSLIDNKLYESTDPFALETLFIDVLMERIEKLSPNVTVPFLLGELFNAKQRQLLMTRSNEFDQNLLNYCFLQEIHSRKDNFMSLAMLVLYEDKHVNYLVRKRLFGTLKEITKDVWLSAKYLRDLHR